MRLSARPLKNVHSLNSFSYANQLFVSAEAGEAEATDLFVQIVDLDQEGIRYMPSSGAVLTAIFPALDDEDNVSRIAVQPFPQDPSIWRIPMLAGDMVSGGNMIFAITEGGVTKKFVVQNALVVEQIGQGGCC